MGMVPPDNNQKQIIRKQSVITNMKKPLKITIGVALLCGTAYMLFAHAIDYVSMATSFNLAATNGMNGDVTITPHVHPGDHITGSVKYSIVTQGQTTNFGTTGKTITFGAEDAASNPDHVPVGGDLPSSHTFLNAASTFTDSIDLTAPTPASYPQTYTVKVKSTGGTGAGGGLLPGNGINITFTVDSPPVECDPVMPSLVVTTPMCVVLHNPNAVTLTATLTDPDTSAPLVGKTISFTVGGNPAGSGITDSNGVATSSYNASALSIGDHEVVASWTSDDTCNYENGVGYGNLGVTYLFIGYQQPINSDGSSIFKGTVIPVKIKISDYNGESIPNADAHVFFAFGTPAIVGDEAEPLANTTPDGGNGMRYDPTADQYIFNWDISRLANGTYTVRVELGEGACGTARTATLSIQKVGKGVKK